MIFDFLYYRLPNSLIYFIFGLFPLFVLSTGNYPLFMDYGLFLITLFVGFLFFALNLFGAGDAKLLAVSSLWVGWTKVTPFLLLMGMMGGLIGVAFICFPTAFQSISLFGRNFCKKTSFLNKFTNFFVPVSDDLEEEILQMQAKKMIPYGAAIATSAIIVLIGLV